MLVTLQSIDLLYFITAVIGLIVAGILAFYRNKKLYKFNFLLSLYFLFLSLEILIGFLIGTRLIPEFPFIYRYENLLVLLCMPFSYLYIRGVVKGKKGQNLTSSAYVKSLP